MKDKVKLQELKKNSLENNSLLQRRVINVNPFHQIIHYDTPFGYIELNFNLQYIQNIQLKPSSPTLNKQIINSPLFEQLEGYFNGSLKSFTVNYELDGTDFQKRVWQALNEIPYGQTMTYKDVASKVDSHPRAVGMACRTNPLPLIIPCHRVVAQNSLGGFMGATQGSNISIKEWLLQHEQQHTFES